MNKPKGSAFAIDIVFDSNGYEQCSQIIVLFRNNKTEVVFVKVPTTDYKNAGLIEKVSEDGLVIKVQFYEATTKAMELGNYDIEIKSKVGVDGKLITIYQESKVFNIVTSYIK